MATAADRSDAGEPSEHPGPAGQLREPVASDWLDEKLQRRLRYSPRLSRLVTTIDLFDPELTALKARCSPPPAHAAPRWQAVADKHLAAARLAANQRRLDDGWDFLHSAQRHALHALTRPEVEDAVAALDRECAAKLVGWRREAAAATVAAVKQALGRSAAREPAAGASREPTDPLRERAPDAAYAALIKTRQILDENSHNSYLRLRLVGQRLLIATVLLAVVLVGLGWAAAADLLGPQPFPKVTVLHEIGTYTTIALLGVLGALLSFSIGTLRSGANRRIYELANGRYAATIARILVGAAAAIVVAVAVESGVVTLNPDWLLILAVAAGFSERFVRRIIESLSADAERSPEPTKSGDGGTS